MIPTPHLFRLVLLVGESGGGDRGRFGGSFDVISRRFLKRDMPRFIEAHRDSNSGVTTGAVLMLSLVLSPTLSVITVYFDNLISCSVCGLREVCNTGIFGDQLNFFSVAFDMVDAPSPSLVWFSSSLSLVEELDC